nr:MAG TPA: hypothetical protein [Bacteriophage sp.]
MLFVLLISFYLCYNIATFLFDWWRFVLGRSEAAFFICKIIIALILVLVNTKIGDFNIIFLLTF